MPVLGPALATGILLYGCCYGGYVSEEGILMALIMAGSFNYGKHNVLDVQALSCEAVQRYEKGPNDFNDFL